MHNTHKYPYIIDYQGMHWLRGNHDSYFNGVVWIQKSEAIIPKQQFGEVTIDEFLLILASALNYDEAL